MKHLALIDIHTDNNFLYYDIMDNDIKLIQALLDRGIISSDYSLFVIDERNIIDDDTVIDTEILSNNY